MALGLGTRVAVVLAVDFAVGSVAVAVAVFFVAFAAMCAAYVAVAVAVARGNREAVRAAFPAQSVVGIVAVHVQIADRPVVAAVCTATSIVGTPTVVLSLAEAACRLVSRAKIVSTMLAPHHVPMSRHCGYGNARRTRTISGMLLVLIEPA